MMRGTDRACQTSITAERGRRQATGFALLTVGVLVSVAGCSDSGTVTKEANLQQTPANASKVVAIVPQGSAITVGECTNGWCRVSWNGHEGYILTKSVRLSERAFRSTPDPDQPPQEDDTSDANAAAPDEVAPSSAN
jgi:hypothetical protein